jgi:hypothetical protein
VACRVVSATRVTPGAHGGLVIDTGGWFFGVWGGVRRPEPQGGNAV